MSGLPDRAVLPGSRKRAGFFSETAERKGNQTLKLLNLIRIPGWEKIEQTKAGAPLAIGGATPALAAAAAARLAERGKRVLLIAEHDLKGKTIVPFCTSGGSGMGNITSRINNLTGREAKVLEGKRYGGTVSMEDLKIWMDDLKL